MDPYDNSIFSTIEKIRLEYPYLYLHIVLSYYKICAQKINPSYPNLNAEEANAIIHQLGQDPLEIINKAIGDKISGYKVARLEKTLKNSNLYECVLINKKGDNIPFLNLSSGESLIFQMLAVWQFSFYKPDKFSNLIDYKKIEIMLLDEPDKHLDPKLCKLFIETINEEFVKKGTQVIMTTHRIDTIALAPKNSIFTIEQDENGMAQISQTHSLLAMFRLTTNLREFSGFHIKVYTEGFYDANFYQKIHALLKENKLKDYKFSNRYFPEFHSLSRTDKNGGGCQAVVDEIIFNIQSLNRKHIDTSIFSGQITLPFGIIDDDNGKYATTLASRTDTLNSNISGEGESCKEHIISIHRYSLENFLFDPFILSSILSQYHNKDAAIELIKNSKLKETISELLSYIQAFEQAEDSENINDAKQQITSSVHMYFQEIIRAGGIRRKKVEILITEAIKTIKTVVVQSNPDYVKISNQIKESKDKASKEELNTIKNLITQELENALNPLLDALDKSQFLEIQEENLVNEIARTISSFYTEYNQQQIHDGIKTKYDRMHDGSAPNDTTNDRGLFARNIVANPASKTPSKDTEIPIIGYKNSISCTYPVEFLSINGHDLDKKGFFLIYNDEDDGSRKQLSEFKRHIKQAFLEADNIPIPQDLIILFLELDCKMREQVNKIIKPETWSSKILSKYNQILEIKENIYGNGNVSFTETSNKIKDITNSINSNTAPTTISYTSLNNTLTSEGKSNCEEYKELLSYGINSTSVNAQTNRNECEDPNISLDLTPMQQNQSIENQKNCYLCYNISYTNPNLILRQDELLHQAGQIAGMDGINRLINLGEDQEVAKGIVTAAKEYGIVQVLNILFADIKSNVLSESALPIQPSSIDIDFSAINISTEKLEVNQSWVERCRNEESINANCMRL